MWWNCFSGNFTVHFLTAIMKINFVVIFRFHESKQKHPTVYKLSHLYLNTLESQSTFIHFQDFFFQSVCLIWAMLTTEIAMHVYLFLDFFPLPYV